MDKVELRFKYTKKEFVKADRQYLFASKTLTKLGVVVILGYLLLSVLYLFFSAFDAPSIIFFMIALFFALALFLLYFFKASFAFNRTAKYHEEYYLAFSEGGIEFRTPTVDSSLKWDIFTEFWESGDFYFMILTKHTYTPIPKRAFENPALKQNFEEIALLHLKCTKRF